MEDDKMYVSEEIKSYLLEISKWSKFLAIVGFVSIGFLILISFFIESFFNLLPNQPKQMIPLNTLSIMYFILAGVYFFPINYLFQFAKNMKNSLQNNGQEEITLAFKNLKSHYKFVGMFFAIILSLYVMIIIVTLLGVAAAAF